MFKDITQSIEHSEFYSIVGLLLFLGAFAVVIYFVARMDKRHVETMSRLPLKPESEERGTSHD